MESVPPLLGSEGARAGARGAVPAEYVLDEDQLARLRHRDPTAQAKFFRHFRERVEAVCARILGPGGDAQELAADVLGDFLYTYVDGVETPRAVPTYLKLMATRRSLRLQKARGRAGEIDDEALPDESGSPDQAIWTQQVMPRLGQCLEGLTPKAQEVLRLRFGTELTNEAIGEIVGGSKQYIGRLIKESTEKLKVCLDR